MEKRNNYVFEIVFLPIIIIIILIISITVYNIQITKKQLENQIKNKKIEYFETQKDTIYNKVQFINNSIKIENNNIESKMKEELKDRIETALKVSRSIYSENKNLSKAKKRELLSQGLSLLSFNKNRGYYFIIDKNKTVLHHPNHNLIGKKLDTILGMNSFDINTENEISFRKYYFYKGNNKKKMFLKIAVLTEFKPLGIVIGTSDYVDDVIVEVKNEFINKLREINDLKKYIFILDLHDINGGKEYATMLVNNNKKELVGKTLSDERKDAVGNFYRKEYLQILRDKEEGFLKYWYKKPNTDEKREKYTYFYLNKQWNWIIASGFYLEDLAVEIDKLNEESNKYLNDLIRSSLFWGLIFLVIMIFLSTIIFYKIQRRIGIDQKRLIQSQENLKKAQKISKMGSWSYNFKTKEIIWSNEIYEILGINKKSKKASFEYFLSLVYEDDKNKINKVFEKLINKQISHDIVHRIFINNKIKWVKNQSEVFIEKNSAIVIGTLQDITEKYEKDKKIEEQAQLLFNQSKMAAMGEMIENIAHQWRQPLSAISTSASGLKLENEYNILNTQKLEDGLDNIIDNTQYLSSTIEDFRKYFAKDKVKIRCNIKTVYENTIKLVKPKFETIDIIITEDCEDLYCVTLESELVQCLMNIFNNAYDVLSKNDVSPKLLCIKTFRKYDNVIIEITDNAGGIKENIIDKIFEPYFTTKHRAQGTGIGLYMTQEIITKHLGGFIKVKNVEFDYENIKYKGASFKISLPLENK